MNTPASDNKKPSTPPPTPGAKSPTPGPTTAASTTPTTTTASTAAATDDKPQTGNGPEESSDKQANRSKVFIVIGEVHEFPTAAAAEKFLNQPNGPTKFSVLKGHKVESKQRVSLRG